MFADPNAWPPLAATDKLILTATLDAASQQHFNELRTAFFPPERNYLDAHLTLFHALPADAVQAMWQSLRERLAEVGPLPFVAPAPYGLGRGVAIAISCDALLRWRKALRQFLLSRGVELTGQDRHEGRLHITVQNKVSPPDAKRTLQALGMAWNSERAGTVTGVALYAYRGGPWEWLTQSAAP